MSDLVLLFCELLNCGKRSQGMQIIIKGKQMEVTSRLRQHIERKVQRLARLVDEEARVEMQRFREEALPRLADPVACETLGPNTDPAGVAADSRRVELSGTTQGVFAVADIPSERGDGP